MNKINRNWSSIANYSNRTETICNENEWKLSHYVLVILILPMKL
jgi:hypothetical protein